MLNVLYYYNCKEKVDAAMNKISMNNSEDKVDDGISGDSTGSKADEANRVKTLQALDDCCYGIHFVLQTLGSQKLEIKDLFKGSDYNSTVESQNIMINIYNVMRLYTKALMEVEE